jgi:hypothetical protein
LAILVPRRSWLEISLWKTGKGRKKEKGAKKRKKRDGIQTAELDRRDQVTAAKSWPSSLRKGGTEVDYQVAAPTESSIPNLHRATIAQQRVRMEGWRQRRLGSTGKNLHQGGKRKTDRKRKIDLTLTGLLMEGI